MKKNTILIIVSIIVALVVGIVVESERLNNKEKRDLDDIGKVTNRRLYKKATVYEKYIKRGTDILFAFCGIVLTMPIVAVFSICIYMEDPGTVIFKQKRIGINKSYFNIHKLRSMRNNTGDIPTHMLSKKTQDDMILKVGRFIRKTSIDELPQFIDIFRGRMSLVGPRPALWNQFDLIEEREKYGANSVRPGLTGLAQISGRDELSIKQKAYYDGEYVRAMKSSSFSGFKMDCRCLLGTIKTVVFSDGVVEGGTGTIASEKEKVRLEKKYIYDAKNIIPIEKKRILIVGANSYIGCALFDYLSQYKEFYQVCRIQAQGLVPTIEQFEGYDVVVNVAGIAHVKETKENRKLYYAVNRDLAVSIAKVAKEAGVSQFILLSSMSVYGKVTGYITKETLPNPVNAYGDSKLQADRTIEKMKTEKFKVAILRPPMVYGKGCKGNYQMLREVALKSPCFANYKNERSMIYIGNLCEFIKCVIDKEDMGLFFPQNAEYVNTSEMVRIIANQHNKKICMVALLNWVIAITPINIVKKVFGTLVYDKVDLIGKYNFKESMELTEGYE